MKTLIILISLFFLQTQLTYASSGRTNSSGCHSSKKGGYHCHGGGSSSYTPTPSVIPTPTIVDIKTNNTDNKFLDPNNVKEVETSITNPTEIMPVMTPTDPVVKKELSVMDKLNEKVEYDNKLASKNLNLKNLFGSYIGENVNIQGMNKVGKSYELNGPYKIFDFDHSYINIEDKKVISILSNKNVDECAKEKESLKLIIEKNFGTEYKFKTSNTSYLLTYQDFVSIISCRENRLSILIKGN
jgi:hypothetical protein